MAGTIAADADMRETRMTSAQAPGACFAGAKLDYADFAHADLQQADFSSARLFFADMHAVRDSGAIWDGAITTMMKRTDSERLEAESWTPPARQSRSES